MIEPPNSDEDSGRHLSGARSDVTYGIDDAERPSVAVVRAVASVTNTAVTDLDPLFEVINPDHLDGIVGDQRAKRGLDAYSVSFSFDGCHVTVTENHVLVREHEPVGE